MNEVMISVSMITYNHEKFIAQAIEGVLMQKTTFPIELIIGEDCSTDNTRSICIEYQEKYPNIIKLRLSDKNMGVEANSIENGKACRGKYIACCEGDDYWIDEYKLQKQYDFMEQNDEYSLTCHRYTILDDKTNEKKSDYVATIFEEKNNPDGIEFYASDIFKIWYPKTMTVVFRNDNAFNEILLNLEKEKGSYKDIYLFYYLLKDRKGYCFNFNGAVYRLHEGGIFSLKNKIVKIIDNIRIYERMLKEDRSDIVIKNQYETELDVLKTIFYSGFISFKHPYFNVKSIGKDIKLYSDFRGISRYRIVLLYPCFSLFYLIKRLCKYF